MREIMTAERKHGHSDLRRLAARYPSSEGDTTLLADGVELGITTEARANQGRWVADCPAGCGGAEFVSFDNPFFFCCECRNAATDHLPIQVKVPAPQTRRDIERYLVARPDPSTRNWEPHETVADLSDENLAHNILLPKD